MKIDDNPEFLNLDLDNISVRINKSPFSLAFYDPNGQLLTETSPSAENIRIKRPGAEEAEKVVSFESFEPKEKEVKVTCLTDNENKFSLRFRHQSKDTLRMELRPVKEADFIKLSWTLEEEDHFFGFGERFNQLDQKGEEVDLWVENGACAGHTYKPIPFFMTPRGYGMSIDTTNRCICRMGSLDMPNRYSLTVMDGEFDLSFFYGPSLKGILRKYLDVVGKPEVPGEWVFGPWKSRDWHLENQETVYEDLNVQRKLDIPCTVKLIDAGWEHEYHTFKFDESKYPEYREMFDKAEKNGYKIILWISPWIMHGTESFERASQKGFLVEDQQGESYVTRLGNSPNLTGGVLDFTNPEVKDWWKKKLDDLMELGAAGFKTDFGEQVPKDAVFFNGKTGTELHNDFPRRYNELTWKVVEKHDGILLARSAWHGSQQFPAVWAGDQSQNFDPSKGLPSAIEAGITVGMSGFPYWGSDVGGYFGEPSDQVFIRWTQFGAFSPIMQVHGCGKHDPWKFEAKTLDLYRKYAELHTRLQPYISKYAEKASEKGFPIMRALPLEYQDDSRIYNLETTDFEYLFGEKILVAPIYFGGNNRSIYLPEGSWVDWWTGEKYEGEQLVENHPAPIERIPIFVGEGGIIPLLPEGVETLLPSEKWDTKSKGDSLTLEVFPDENSSFRMKSGEFSIDKTEKGYEVNMESLNYNRIAVKMMDSQNHEVSQIDGGKVMSNSRCRSTLAKIDSEAGDYFGREITIEPASNSVYLELTKGE